MVETNISIYNDYSLLICIGEFKFIYNIFDGIKCVKPKLVKVVSPDKLVSELLVKNEFGDVEIEYIDIPEMLVREDDEYRRGFIEGLGFGNPVNFDSKQLKIYLGYFIYILVDKNSYISNNKYCINLSNKTIYLQDIIDLALHLDSIK